MTTDKIEETIKETIKEIAAKHGIVVGRDDPILILQTINDRLMQDRTAQPPSRKFWIVSRNNTSDSFNGAEP